MGNFFGRIVGKFSLSRSTTKVSSSGRASRMSSSPSTSVSNSTRNENNVHLPSSSESIEDFYGNGDVHPTPKLRIFTFAELKSATRNFKPDTVLGEGGFGKVYKGWVDEKTMNPAKSGTGMMVAVKKMNKESVQGLQEWQSEIDFLGWLSHPNLVRLLGYCWEDSELLLVYEFMAKGSLDNHLFKKDRFHETLSWNLRLKIAIGAARGLDCLHSSEKQIIYRDLKAANILLDSDYNAKLSDFGLAKHGPAAGASHVTTHPKGTYGYAAPEYLSTGHLSIRSDVYGFGVVLLEILSGEKAFDLQRPSQQYSLVEWAKPHLGNRKKIRHIMDQRLEGQYPPKAAAQVAELAQKCFASSPKSRPTMKEVVESLEQIITLSGDTTNSPAATLRQTRGCGQTPPRYRSPRHAM